MTTYFENIIVRLHILYARNTHVKYHANPISSTIRFINLFFLSIIRISFTI